MLTMAFAGNGEYHSALLLDSQAAAGMILAQYPGGRSRREAYAFQRVRCPGLNGARGASRTLGCTCLDLCSSFSCYHVDVTPVWRTCDKFEICDITLNVSVACPLTLVNRPHVEKQRHLDSKARAGTAPAIGR